ncbi:hypothetical protein SETIT_6G153300v2 [Setaria italica]|uniref:Uncharacterized protein n=1 Tax=Setaria italica TaxID=4555 RepID=A0A368RM81_SETIT|nr:hypothetical protein SETIT_6G153300v2 [Setaria italica]
MEVPMNSAQSGAHFPVQHRSLSLDIKGNKTDIVISKYEDIFLVIVTQIGCMGTILAAKKHGSVFSDPTYNVNVLFGKRDEKEWDTDKHIIYATENQSGIKFNYQYRDPV